MKYEEHIEKIANIFYEAIEKGTAPWVKPWKAEDFKSQSHNPVTKTIYKGMNSFMLDMIRIDNNYKENAWLTFKQIKDLGGTVVKGSKASDVIFFEKRPRTDEDIERKEKKLLQDNTIPSDLKKILIDENREKKVDMIFKSSNVFNIEQTINIDKDKIKALYKDNDFEKKDFISIQDCQKVLDNVKDLEIKHFRQSKAYYSPVKDEIVLPEKEQFSSPESYYSVAFHELGHSTGHEKRLNRDLSDNPETKSYAKEELRAEIYSFLQAKELGMDYNLENHQSYVKSWAENLKDKKTEIYEAVKDSFKMVTFVKENYIDKALEKDKTIEINKNQDLENGTKKPFFKPKDKKSVEVER